MRQVKIEQTFRCRLMTRSIFNDKIAVHAHLKPSARYIIRYDFYYTIAVSFVDFFVHAL